MRTLNRITEEFVRHHRFLVEQTGDDPGRLAAALDELPELTASTARLHEIDRAVQRHRYFGKLPFIVQTHPDFRRALSDFRGRWASAYSEVRARDYETQVRTYEVRYPQAVREAASRVSEEFLRHYRQLTESMADNPSAVGGSNAPDPQLAYAFGVLESVYAALSDPDGYEKGIAQLNANAREVGRLISEPLSRTVDDFGLRWRRCFSRLVEKEAELCDFVDYFPDEYSKALRRYVQEAHHHRRGQGLRRLAQPHRAAADQPLSQRPRLPACGAVWSRRGIPGYGGRR